MTISNRPKSPPPKVKPQGPLFPPVFTPTVSRPLVDDFTLRALRQQQRSAPPGVPLMHPLPLREHPLWSGNNELGRELPFAPDANNRQMILKLGTWGPPEVWSVMLGMSRDDSAASLFGVTAEINAGAGGIVQSFELDWIEGTTFSCVMSALDITARYAANPSSVPSNLRLSAVVGKGKIAGRPPTKTIQIPAVVTGGGTVVSTPVRIPRFARSVMVLDRSTTPTATVYSAAFSMQFLGNSAGSQVGEVTGDVLRDFASNGYPISDFARYVQLTAAAPLVSVSPTLVFFLAL